jgi:hypothetical protein
VKDGRPHRIAALFGEVKLKNAHWPPCVIPGLAPGIFNAVALRLWAISSHYRLQTSVAVSMNECLLVAAGHSQSAGPDSANSARQANVRSRRIETRKRTIAFPPTSAASYSSRDAG